MPVYWLTGRKTPSYLFTYFAFTTVDNTSRPRVRRGMLSSLAMWTEARLGGGGGGGGVIGSWGVSLYRLGISESMRSFTGLPFLEIATFIIWITSCIARFAFVVFRRYTLIVCFSTACMLLLLGLPVWKRGNP